MEKKTHVDNHDVEAEAKSIEENPEHLQRLLHSFTQDALYAVSRKARMETLMQRKSARKWKPKKTARQVRRLLTADQTIEQASGIIDQIKHRLEQLGARQPQL